MGRVYRCSFRVASRLDELAANRLWYVRASEQGQHRGGLPHPGREPDFDGGFCHCDRCNVPDLAPELQLG